MQNLKYCLVFKKCFLLLFFSLNSSVILFSQSLLPEVAPKPVQNSEQIKWYTMEEAGKAYQNNPKPMFIDLYTEWCGWCKKMDVGTFKDKDIIAYLNANFYPVKFNAESKDTINVFGRKFWNSQDAYVVQFLKTSDSTIKILNDSLALINNKKKSKLLERIPAITAKIDETTLQKNNMQRQGGRTSHDLARDLMNNQMSYPTFVFLFDSLRQNFPLKGYQQPIQLLPALSFISDGVFKSTANVTEYQNQFTQLVNSNFEVKSSVKWMDPVVLSKPNVTGKKTLILITSDNFFSSQVMEKGVFNDAQISYYINKEFIPVSLSINHTSALKFKETNYSVVNGIHELPLLLLQNEINFPTMVILDENYNIITKIPGFYPPMDLESILAFFKEDAFKTSKYPDFKKEFDVRTK